MAVTRTEGDRTLYRDRLDISAGLLTPFVWIGAWAFWQWRAFQLTRLAPGWKTPASSRSPRRRPVVAAIACDRVARSARGASSRVRLSLRPRPRQDALRDRRDSAPPAW